VKLETPPPPEGAAAPADNLAAFPPPETQGPAAVSGSELPDFAKKADDLEAIKRRRLTTRLRSAAACGCPIFADLFLERSVKLPFLNIELPLLAFFFLAPILFLVVHAYTLVHLVMLTEKAKRYHQALHDPKRAVTNGARENLQWQLPSNIFIQFLAGPSGLRGGLFGWLLRTIGWMTLVIAPVLLVLMIQVQFLPFHSSFITWTQRIALVVDLLLIWWMWRKILSGREADSRRRVSWGWPALGLVLSLGVVLLSWVTAIFPGEWQDRFQEKHYSGDRRLHDLVFNGPVNDVTRHRASLFSSTLVLTGFNIYEGLGIDDPEKAKWHDFIFRARARDLKGAIFDLAILPRVDFEGADLLRASLAHAQLQGASLDHAQLQGAGLDDAQLQGASLDDAQLQGASLNFARLQGASLFGAQLQGASLQSAELEGSSLDSESSECAMFTDRLPECSAINPAQLQAASLDAAQLQGASLFGAQLQGASFDRAQLQGVKLQLASLDATDLETALLWRTDGGTLSRGDAAHVAMIKLPDPASALAPVYRDEHGQIQSWDTAAYDHLRKTIGGLPEVRLRDLVLEQVGSLDCASSDKTLASCDRHVSPPPEAAAWGKVLEAASVSKEAYAEALAKVLKELVCSGNDDAIHVARGPGFRRRLEAAGAAAIDLIGELTNKDSKDCPVSAALTSVDRARLRNIKMDIEKAGK